MSKFINIRCLIGLRLIYSALILFIFNTSAISQIKISIQDDKGSTLPGTHIKYKEIGKKYQTVLTDLDGVAIINPDSKNTPIPIYISYVGFFERVDTVRDGDNKTFRLEVDNISLNQVVITGQYKEGNPEKSVHKVKIIEKKAMDKRGVVNLNDALQFETNMRISQDNVLGSAASIQGLSGENVKILIDGVPMVGRQDGNIDLNQINMNNVERIEIVEGPLSVNYGTNALAGTINIITKKNQKERYDLSANTYYESVGQYNADGAFGFSKNNQSIKSSFGRNFFDGWSPNEEFSFLPHSTLADTSRNLQWKPKEQIFGDIQYSIKIGKINYRAFANAFQEEIISRGTPRAPYNLTAFDEHFITKRIMGGVDVGGQISENTRWNALASYSDYSRSRYTYFKDLVTLNEDLTLNPEDHDTTRIKSGMSRGAVRFLPANRKLNWELGYDVNFERANGKRIENNLQEMGDYALFTTAEWSIMEGVIIKPGLRYAYNTAYKAPIIPSLNFKYERNNTSYRMSYARGFRAPGLKELYFEFVDINHNIYGNQNLLAESSNNFQLDVTWKLVKKQRVTQIESGFFFNDVFDMISLSQIERSNDYTYINVGRFRTQGVDVSLNQSFNHWKVSVGLVYTGRSDILEDEVSKNMYYSSEVRTALTYEFKRLGGNLAAFYKFNGELPVYNIDEVGKTEQVFSESYNMIDLAATKYLFNKKLNWTIGVKNLLDVKNINSNSSSGGVHNTSSGSIPVAWGRSFFTSLKFNLSWK